MTWNRLFAAALAAFAAPAALFAADLLAPTPVAELELCHPMILAFGDLDNDGEQDLVASYEVEPNKKYGIALFVAKDGAFPTTPTRILKDDLPCVRGFFVADLDGDGKSDLVAATEKDLWVFHGKDDFADPSKDTDNNRSRGLPLYVTKSPKGAWRFLVGPAYGDYADGGKIAKGYIYSEGWKNKVPFLRLLPADFDGDGNDELVGVQADSLRILEGPFAGRLIHEETCASSTVLPNALPVDSIDTGDFDGDGQRDIAFVGGKGGAILFQNTPVGFDENCRKIELPAGRRVLAADLRKRGQADLLLIAENQVVIYDGLQLAQTIKVPGAYEFAYGKPGLAVARFGKNRISIFR